MAWVRISVLLLSFSFYYSAHWCLLGVKTANKCYVDWILGLKSWEYHKPWTNPVIGCVFITALWLYVFGSSDDLNIECQPHKRGHIRGHLSSFTLPRSPIKPSACHMAHCSFFLINYDGEPKCLGITLSWSHPKQWPSLRAIIIHLNCCYSA